VGPLHMQVPVVAPSGLEEVRLLRVWDPAIYSLSVSLVAGSAEASLVRCGRADYTFEQTWLGS
jgi:hypothetical protein